MSREAKMRKTIMVFMPWKDNDWGRKKTRMAELEAAEMLKAKGYKVLMEPCVNLSSKHLFFKIVLKLGVVWWHTFSLGMSFIKMSQCCIVYFGIGWEEDPHYEVLHKIAESLHYEILYESKGENTMENKKSPLPEHVIRAMRRDDGFIRCEAGGRSPQYVVYVLTADGYKSLCTVSAADMVRLYKDGIIKHVGDGKWKLRKQLPDADDGHKL